MLFDLIWQHASHGFAAVGHGGNVIAANPAFARLLKLGEHDVRGAHLSALLPDIWEDIAQSQTTKGDLHRGRTCRPMAEICIEVEVRPLNDHPDAAFLIELSPRLDALPIDAAVSEICRACVVKEVAAAANIAPTPEASIRVALEALARHLHAHLAHAWVVDERKHYTLTSSGVWIGPTDGPCASLRHITGQQEYPIGAGFPGRVMERRLPIWIADLARSDDHLKCVVRFSTRSHITDVSPEDILRLGAALQSGLRSVFGFPVMVDGEVVAVLEFFSRQKAIAREHVIEVASELGLHVGFAIARKRAELALREAVRAAEAANRAKSVFLASVSHEIRTPLTAIVGFAELMQRDVTLSMTQRDQLDTIVRSSEHLAELLNDVLDLARIEAGREEIRPSVVDLMEFERTLHGMFAARAQARGLQFTINTRSVPRWIVTDPSKLRQIVINLVNNALKFTESGSIHVRCSTSHQPDHRLLIEVEDTGSGVEDELRDRIFEAFERSHRHEFTEGVGLGLQISRKFARLLGGDITFESEPGMGSRFVLNIPLKQPAAPTPQSPNALVLPAGMPPPLVLVADSDEASRIFIGRALIEAGFKVRTAVDTTQALIILKIARPEIVIFDLGSEPDQTLAVLTQMRLHASTQTMILATSTQALFSMRDRATTAGADAFLTKPFRSVNLLDMLRQAPALANAVALDEVLPAEPPPTLAELTHRARSLPPSMLDQIRLHIQEAELDSLTEISSEVRLHDRELATALRQYVEAYDYDALVHIFAES